MARRNIEILVGGFVILGRGAGLRCAEGVEPDQLRRRRHLPAECTLRQHRRTKGARAGALGWGGGGAGHRDQPGRQDIQETGEDDWERSDVVIKAGEIFPLYQEFTAAVSLNYDKSAPGPKDFFIVIDGKIKATLPWTGVLLVGKHIFVCEAPDGRKSRPETKLIFFKKANAFVFSWND